MDIHGYSAHVLVNGRKVKEYRHNGLTFIEAKNGTEFAIEVKNHLGGRILAVVSVDGLDIIEGKPATVDSRGYIIGPYSADTFQGWRKSDTEIGAFQFTSSDKSYATEKGKGQNNGIIAIKLFAEKLKLPVWHHTPQTTQPSKPWNPNAPLPMYSGSVGYNKGILRSVPPIQRQNVNQFGKLGTVESSILFESDSDKAAFDMGTTWGSKKEDKVVTSEFERGTELATLEFYYASREALQALGIPLVAQREVSLPKGFASTSYAQPPKNWK